MPTLHLRWPSKPLPPFPTSETILPTPPYSITPAILRSVGEIGEAIGRAETAGLGQDLRLRRVNRIRTIHGSLAIEGNRLSEEQISTILDGKPVVGPLRDIQEARNAIEVYDRCQQWDPVSESHLLGAHEVLMRALLDSPGRYRTGSVVVMGGDEVQHNRPPCAPGAGPRGQPSRVATAHRRASADLEFGLPLRIRVHPSLRRRQRADGTAFGRL